VVGKYDKKGGEVKIKVNLIYLNFLNLKKIIDEVRGKDVYII